MDRRFLLILLVLFVGFIGFLMFSKQGNMGEGDSVSSVGSQNFYGKMDSPVTLVEFVDFQCEACYAYYPSVKQLKAEYGDRVKFQVRNFPITSGHQFAFQAARAAEAAARQNKFWEMHDKIFEGQKTWEQTQDPGSIFEGYAQSIGLDMEKFKTDRNSSEVAAVINKDLADTKEIGASGTPTFVLNGKKIDNPGQDYEALKKILDDALAEAGQN